MSKVVSYSHLYSYILSFTESDVFGFSFKPYIYLHYYSILNKINIAALLTISLLILELISCTLILMLMLFLIVHEYDLASAELISS